MKSIGNYISEKLIISKDIDIQYKYYPKTKLELKMIIKKRIDKEGWECDLNDIDVSAISDMSHLFYGMHDFNCNISNWDVSEVTNTSEMFSYCGYFNCDISGWDVSSVTNMALMFNGCHKFDGKKLEDWDVSNVEKMNFTFDGCKSAPTWYKE